MESVLTKETKNTVQDFLASPYLAKRIKEINAVELLSFLKPPVSPEVSEYLLKGEGEIDADIPIGMAGNSRQMREYRQKKKLRAIFVEYQQFMAHAGL